MKRRCEEEDGNLSPALISSSDDQTDDRKRKRKRTEDEPTVFTIGKDDVKTIRKKRKTVKRDVAQQQKFQDELLLSTTSVSTSPDNNSKKISNHLKQVLQVTNANAANEARSSKSTGITLTNILEESIPMDWSIRRTIRITSPNSFSWTTNLSSLAQSSGVSSFIRGSKVDTSSYMNPRGNTQQV
jgi:hypothetical protein